MKTKPDSSEQLLITRIKSTALLFLYRSLSFALVISFLQVADLKITRAEEVTQTEARIFDHRDEREQQSLSSNSTLSRLNDTFPSQFEDEVNCLALNIYFEARGEPENGQRAVGHVVMNRVAHARYPNSVCEVVHQGGEKQLHRCQFSWWCDGRSDKPLDQGAWVKARQLARRIYLGDLKDTTDGALWYHATYVTPYWSQALRQGDKIGQHIFYLAKR